VKINGTRLKVDVCGDFHAVFVGRHGGGTNAWCCPEGIEVSYFCKLQWRCVEAVLEGWLEVEDGGGDAWDVAGFGRGVWLFSWCRLEG